MDFLWIILTSGIPGFFSYWFLSRLDMMKFDEGSQDEKRIVLGGLSLINVSLSLAIFGGLFSKGVSEVLEADTYSALELIYLLLVAIAVNLTLTVFIYPKSYKVMKPIFDDHFEKATGVINTSNSLMEDYFKNDKYNRNFVVLFDFDDKFIQFGEWNGKDDKNDNKLGILNVNHKYKEYFKDYDEILNYFETIPRDSCRLVLDYENKIKIFIFYYNNQ